MIHCSRRSVFNCPQHKLIAYVSIDFFLLPKQGFGKKVGGRKAKKFTIFKFSDTDCYVVSSYTGKIDTMRLIMKIWVYADIDKSFFYRVTSVKQQINAKNHAMFKESQDSFMC